MSLVCVVLQIIFAQYAWTIKCGHVYLDNTQLKYQVDLLSIPKYMLFSSVYADKCQDNTFKYAMFISFQVLICSPFVIIFLQHSVLFNLFLDTASLKIPRINKCSLLYL